MFSAIAPENPVTRRYPWRHFPLVFFASSCVALVTLTLLNAAVAGYETVSTERGDKNVTQVLWWTPFIPGWLGPSSTCDDHAFGVGNAFQTNNSLFKWTVLHVNTSVSDKSSSAAGFQYAASPMSVCEINTNDGFALTVDSNTATVQAWGVYSCRSGGPEHTPFDIQGSYEFTVAETDLVYPPGSVVIPVNDVLGRLSQDLLESILIPPSPGAQSFVRVGVAGTPYCSALNGTNLTSPDQGDAFGCSQLPILITFRGVQVSIQGGPSSYIFDFDDLGDAKPAFRNFLAAFMEATDIDLGIYQPNSIYFDMTMFNDTITSYPLREGSHFSPTPGDDDLSWPYNAWSSTATNWSNAQILRTYPAHPAADGFIPINSSFHSPAIIDVPYLCHDLRIKSPLSFMASVFVGTASMFMAWVAVVLYIASALAKRTPQAGHGEWSEESGRPELPMTEVPSRADHSQYWVEPLRDSETDSGDWEKDALDAVSPIDHPVEHPVMIMDPGGRVGYFPPGRILRV
ncbi:hypothetical protein JAAARDRAFT_209240 [Jaapia argillacea MUCL 33604]|uniref:Uncharacterized protein n=1 Tax=Jaapia argillacea MUCL 33604 TaxID=933084 RepID=A0A067PVZ2_9AGAM|nr:hypothetical protein JAAARDRAFT_209240 [Jaapia argillacea MUCL 33604]